MNKICSENWQRHWRTQKISCQCYFPTLLVCLFGLMACPLMLNLLSIRYTEWSFAGEELPIPIWQKRTMFCFVSFVSCEKSTVTYYSHIRISYFLYFHLQNEVSKTQTLQLTAIYESGLSGRGERINDQWMSEFPEKVHGIIIFKVKKRGSSNFGAAIKPVTLWFQETTFGTRQSFQEIINKWTNPNLLRTYPVFFIWSNNIYYPDL